MISIIIPVYNKESCIKETINSVLKQTYTQFEILCVDDGSTDNSINVIKELEDDRIKLFSKKNGGVSSARNFGINKAEGEWLFFLDADDILLPNALEILINAVTKTKSTIAIANFYIKSNKFKCYCKTSFNLDVGSVYRAVIMNKCLPRTGNIIIHSSLFKGTSFNEMLRKNEDVDFFIRLIGNKKAVISPTPVMIYELANNSLSKAKNNENVDYAFNIKIIPNNLYINIYLGMVLWDSMPSILCGKNKFNNYSLLLISFLPFIIRSLKFKFSQGKKVII